MLFVRAQEALVGPWDALERPWKPQRKGKLCCQGCIRWLNPPLSAMAVNTSPCLQPLGECRSCSRAQGRAARSQLSILLAAVRELCQALTHSTVTFSRPEFHLRLALCYLQLALCPQGWSSQKKHQARAQPLGAVSWGSGCAGALCPTAGRRTGQPAALGAELRPAPSVFPSHLF